MNPRNRRLLSDLDGMNALGDRGVIDFRCEGDPPERYEVKFEAPGLALDGDGVLVMRSSHLFEAYLHVDYPRQAPLIAWKSKIFHPNILSPERRGGVCIGSWSPSESLADLCGRLIELATFRDLNLEDALDKDAAEWLDQIDFGPSMEISQLVGRSVAGELPTAKAKN